MQTIVTHNGNFHPDDVLAVATLQLHLGVDDVEVIRTRDDAVIKEADWVVDVGEIFDAAAKRFDHHQNGAPERDNGIPYSSFGLVWRELGEVICGSKDAAEQIERRLAQPIDAGDNGISLYEKKSPDVSPYELFCVIGSYRPVWGSDEDTDEAFLRAVDFARSLLDRLVKHAQADVALKIVVQAGYEAAEDKSILVFDDPIDRHYLIDYPEVKVVVYSSRADRNKWKAATVPTGHKAFESRVDFPVEWGGLRDEELSEISGIPAAIFCHKGLFLFGAETKEAAIAAAKLAV